MNQFITGIKALIKNFINICSTAEPINDLSDYYRVKKWVRKVSVLYAAFSVLAIIVIFIVFANITLFELPRFFAYTVVPVLILLTGWGYATLIMYLPKVIKSVVKSGKTGYNIGETFETTHVQVTHEFGNNYRVSSYTENKGCLFAVIAGTARFMVWAFFCVYIGPFITFKRVRDSIKNLNNYKSN